MQKKILQKTLMWGIVASLGMTGFYLSIMLLTMSAREMWENFSFYWYLISGIIIGFGVQIGLWVYLKNVVKMHGSGAMTGMSGAASGTAMLACCAHHLADFLPILGL